MAKVIYTDGRVEDITLNPKDTQSWVETVKGILDGYIETVRLTRDKILIVNEEGKLIGLEYNQLATYLLERVGIDDYICGNAILINNDEIE